MKVVRYASPESLLREFWSFGGEAPEVDPVEDRFYGETLDGDEAEYSWEDMLDGVCRMGLWGYCNGKGEIHCWAKPDVAPELVMEFLGHELAHVRRYDKWAYDRDAVPGDHEGVANIFGTVACEAYALLPDVIEKQSGSAKKRRRRR